MTMSYNETKSFVELVLNSSADQARNILYIALSADKRTEGEFYAGIVQHAPAMKLSTAQWFDILSKLPIRILRSELDLNGLLSEEHLKRLPPVTG